MGHVCNVKRNILNAIKINYGPIRHLSAVSFEPPKYDGRSYEELCQIRKTRLSPALTTIHKKPLLIHSGYMQWLFDHNNKRYLDMFGGIVTVSVGHCHPKVVQAANKQMNRLGHTTNIYMHPNIHEYAVKLTDKFPGDLKVAYFVNSGSEANDMAILLARLYTKKNEIISLRNAYHGMSYQTSGLTANKAYKYPINTPNGILHAMNPDPYRGIWGGNKCRESPVQTSRTCECTGTCAAKDQYVEQFKELTLYSANKDNVAGFFAESIQGVGGSVQFPKGYIKEVAEYVRSNGGVYIADEVQTGFGRTGDYYWGFESHDVIPDIVTMAKGIGNGYPLAAVVTTPEIAQVMSCAAHFNTYGGNPVASAIGMAVLDVIEEDGLQNNSKAVGTHLLHQLARLRTEFDCVGDVRGLGLMIGVELVEDSKTRRPIAPEKMMNVWDTCKDNGVLLGRGGVHGNVFRIKPPMCITKEDAEFTVNVLRDAIGTNV